MFWSLVFFIFLEYIYNHFIIFFIYVIQNLAIWLLLEPYDLSAERSPTKDGFALLSYDNSVKLYTTEFGICIYMYLFHPRYLHNDIFR